MTAKSLASTAIPWRPSIPTRKNVRISGWMQKEVSAQGIGGVTSQFGRFPGTALLRGLDSWIGEKKGILLGIMKFMSPTKLRRADLKTLFADLYRDGKVEAIWFSGDLRIPDGKMLEYAHMGYGSVYERDIVLTVEQGQVRGKVVLDNTKHTVPSRLELERQELEKMKGKNRRRSNAV